ncbi:MAG: hypothetical protein FKY71_16400 [Spiribacter salinus]|uniref:DoxX family protein n=1 Tax=Spiribacter salinus TaxID=1335746 RepID=A0A540VJF0_9GAMM|nr:MAG: hypothetical protein FKY71_16400 [Spiribacter salinus]
MNTTIFMLNLFSALSFYGFGLACLSTEAMRAEFARYHLDRYRAITGWLQLAGATGLVVGIWLPAVGFAAALGISLQMLAGFGVRIYIRDKWLQCFPAAFYCILNAGLAAAYWSL